MTDEQYGKVRGGYSAVEVGYIVIEVDNSAVEGRYGDFTKDTWIT